MKISGTVHNEGRFDAQIESCHVVWHAFSEKSSTGRRLSIEIPDANIDGVTPRMSLPAQAGFEFTVTGISDADPGLSAALHDRRAVTIGFRTATGKWARRRVKYK